MIASVCADERQFLRHRQNIASTSWGLILGSVRLDKQDQNHREHRKTGEHAEDRVDRHLSVAQHAEAPVGQSTTTDADEFPDAVTDPMLVPEKWRAL
jgi:hypothetical protein